MAFSRSELCPHVMSPRLRIDPITRWIRRARWRAARSSPASDREFHDALFSAQRYDPFTPSYAGYVTIRRFADLAAVRLGPSRVVADIGCGPGEVTCELARRLPDVRFLGFDHSGSAITRAREHAASLQLANVSFEAADARDLALAPDVHAAVMFDAFHHLPDPAAFIDRHTHIGRWVLIEPAGDALGRWRWDIDLDWLPIELDKVRQRFESEVSTQPVQVSPAPAVVPSAEDAAVERRYTLEDFEHFFEGFGIAVQGTLAGLMTYPPNAFAHSSERDLFGEFLYGLFCHADALLHAQQRDLAARHWCVTAVRGGITEPRKPVQRRAPEGAPPQVQGAYDIEYISCTGPTVLAPGSEAHYRVKIRNRGWQAWHSDVDPPILVSYHWLARDGRMLVSDGVRSALPRPVQPGDVAEAYVTVVAPQHAGRFVLQIDLVHEGVTWFSGAGQPPFDMRCVVGRRVRNG